MNPTETLTSSRRFSAFFVLGLGGTAILGVFSFLTPALWIYLLLAASLILTFDAFLLLIVARLTLDAQRECDYEQKMLQSKGSQLFDAQNVVREKQLVWRRFTQWGIPLGYALIFLGTLAGIATFFYIDFSVETAPFLHYAILLAVGLFGIALWVVAKLLGTAEHDAPLLSFGSGTLKLESFLILFFVARELVASYARNAGFSDPISTALVVGVLMVVCGLLALDHLISLFRYIYRPKNTLSHFSMCAPLLPSLLGTHRSFLEQIKESLHYQFGITFESEKVIRTFLIALIPFVMFQFLILFGLSRIVLIEPYQCGIMPDGTVLESGLHVCLARPNIVDSARLHSLTISPVDVTAPVLLKTSLPEDAPKETLTVGARADANGPQMSLFNVNLNLLYTARVSENAKETLARILTAQTQKAITDFVLAHPETIDQPEALKQYVFEALKRQHLPVVAVQLIALAPPTETTEKYYARTLTRFEGMKNCFDAEKRAVQQRNSAVVDALKMVSQSRVETLEKATRSAILAYEFQQRKAAYQKLGSLYKSITALNVMKTYYAPLRKLFFAIPNDATYVKRVIMELDLQEEIGPSMLDPLP